MGELMGSPPTARRAVWSAVSFVQLRDLQMVERWNEQDTPAIQRQLGQPQDGGGQAPPASSDARLEPSDGCFQTPADVPPPTACSGRTSERGAPARTSSAACSRPIRSPSAHAVSGHPAPRGDRRHTNPRAFRASGARRGNEPCPTHVGQTTSGSSAGSASRPSRPVWSHRRRSTRMVRSMTRPWARRSGRSTPITSGCGSTLRRMQ